MNEKRRRLSGIGMLYREFSVFKGAQAALVVLDLMTNGIKLLLAYVYLYLLDHMETVSLQMVAGVGLLTLLAIGVSQGAWMGFSLLEERCLQEGLLRTHQALFDAHRRTQLFALERCKSGKWISLLEDNAKKCAGFFGEVLVPFIRGLLLFIGALVMGAFLSPFMTLIVLVCSTASGILMKYFDGKIFAAYGEQAEGGDEVQSTLLGCIQNAETVKAYQYESASAQRFAQVCTEFAKKAISAAKKANLLFAFSIGSGFTISTLWMVIGIFGIFKGMMTVGAFSAFLMLSDYFNWPFFSVPKLYAGAIEALVSYQRLREFQEMEKETPKECSCSEKEMRLEVKDVTFAYEEAAPVLRGFSCEIRQGQKVAVTGESGSGKTTLIKLMMGLYRAAQGEAAVVYENRRLQEQSIQPLIAYAPQAADLFHATVAENIRLGNPGASDAMVREAARLACADDFILALPQGYQTVVGKHSQIRLSGGQVQRIALSRALVKQAPIYVLDEVTSALDAENESKIMQNLLALPQTILFVAHKQALIDACDTVIHLK